MGIEKVIRIVAVTLVAAAFAVRVATRLLLPDAATSCDGILAIVLLLCLGDIWRGTARTESRHTGRQTATDTKTDPKQQHNLK